MVSPSQTLTLTLCSQAWSGGSRSKATGIDKTLGALRQIGVKSNELSGQSLQRMYSGTPAHVRIFERTPRPKKHQPEFVYENPCESDIEPEYAYSHLHHIKSISAKPKQNDKNASNQQTGFGLTRKSIVPPGQNLTFYLLIDLL